MSQGSQKNDAFLNAAMQFMQAGQNATQQFLNFVAQAGEPAGKPVAPADPKAMTDLQKAYMEQHGRLWQAILARGLAQAEEGNFKVAPEPGDRRFAAPEWRDSPVFDYLHQAYLLNTKYLRDLVEVLPAESDKSRDKMRFLARQITDALAPSNFAATNPEFIKRALDTQGKSITDGINNLISDLEKGRISMTDESVFQVGGNIANSAGAVVFENEVMQLIQYAPLTAKVGARPLVIVPPCINKFYILDLQPDNSFVRYAVEQGHTVFLVSWRNPTAEQGHLTWDDYLEHGPIAALHVAKEICRTAQVNALGFCVGGTILTSALAVLSSRDEDIVASLTLLTTLLDFSDTGEIGLFIDEQGLAAREATIGAGGLLPARDLQNTFSFLRANDLVWNYVTQNYLKGQKPQAFDLLYWNADSTNLPGPFACWYMRNLYHDNALRVPGRLSMCGTRVDLGRVAMPVYLLATREDHIVPWHSAYQSTRLLGGPTRFVLGASGHIAGVINPASKNKRSYWVNPDVRGDAESWLAAAEEKKGSWWSDWTAWLAPHAGDSRSARTKLGNARYKAIEPAPGRYVRERAV
ncbi:MAG: class I poly(R)-hydroxyalkanoic acid synthase [Betaproteobacteria bacterium]|jgi:polyhydroxyalkanoate synthase|nr:class I poly(R)-hydroxyalkanoic acid synthase [Betaproteobacteria bacterium]HMV21333.1 class I poly(R)-hydroxyalkanoic acid synthase [Rhodocyclaceae bacterium]HMW76381.1 class I poly(R)-hydroxyalkanoic acid synthase [Rhodocyclaceae bacterium]HNE41911.1 class I poly(R)-hydroxyalkanoic acid synthase [Rhodocyclaceae bacterium]HNL21449.1 class I poly(R)-hydroxyalkanoic acid synthase [Rhodocyclaceae bacterium]